MGTNKLNAKVVRFILEHAAWGASDRIFDCMHVEYGPTRIRLPLRRLSREHFRN